MAITFFDILGIKPTLDDATKVEQASGIWPARKVHFLLGDINISEPVDDLMRYLQASLHFKSIRSGATPDTVGFYAEFEVKNPPTPAVPLVIRTMPDVAFFLQDTGDGCPARCYVTKTNQGVEVILEALPVEIRLPGGLLEPITDTGSGEPPSPLTNPFVAGIYDSYHVDLKTSDPSSIFVHTRVRVTQELDFIIEPAVVLSVGPCLFSGLPCFGVHDISLIPAPTLTGVPPDKHQKVEQAIEWTRHTIEPSKALIPGDADIRGVLAVRTIDLNSNLSPMKELDGWLNSGQPQPGQIQFVLEDVVIPFFGILHLPIPIHGRLGIRRNIEFGDRFEEAFSFASAPIKIAIAGFLLLIEELVIESVDPDDITANQFAHVNITITRGELPVVTTLDTPIDKSATAINVKDASGFKEITLPTDFVIDRTDPVNRELVTVHTISGNAFSEVDRGQHGTAAVPHAIGATIEVDRFAENAITLGFTDEWTAQAGWRRDKGIHVFTLGDNSVKLMGARLGFSFKRLYEQNHNLKDYHWYEFWQLLLDLNLEVKQSQNQYFRIEILSQSFTSKKDPIDIVWKDVGWNLGSIALGGVQLPEGTQIVIVNFIKIILQEIAIVTDKNGGTYFSVTGGLGLGSDKYSASIVVYRFRWRIAGNPSAAKWLLDGISFSLKINTFELTGTGMASENTINQHLYREMAFGLDLKFNAFSKHFELAVFLFKGEVSGPVDNFKYRMFGFKLAYIPAVAGLDLYNIRLMAANNLAPKLAPPDASDQNLRIFKWYQQSTAPLSIPDIRKLDAWQAQDDTFAFGVGTAGAFGGTKALLLDVFVFGLHSPADNAFMIAMELFLLKSQKPVGFGVLEVDLESGKWALFVSISLSFKNVLPDSASSIPGLENVGALSGNLYLGNKPGTFALGQLSDQNTWLAFRMKQDEFFKLELIVALCIQFVDREEGPKGFGGLISAKGGANFGLLKAEFYFNFQLIAGIWKNESSASGLILVFEAGFRVILLRIFRFGVSVKIQLDYLGPNPEYKHLAFEFHLDTPWYLPDVTIRYEKIYSSPQPEKQALVSTPIISAEAFGLGAKQAGPVLLTALTGAAIDEKQLFDLDTLRGLAPQDLPQSTLDGMTAVGVDSTIALNFKVPVDDKLTIGENTPPGAGTQAAIPPASSELSITTELVSLSIRRQPRYGSNANLWTTLLPPGDTQLPPLDDWPSGDQLKALFSSSVKALWDRDVQSQGRFDPRRLLLNSDTPFTLITENAEADESILILQEGWPCCDAVGPKGKDIWHRIFYPDSLVGQRVSGFQVFTDSQSTLQWMLDPRPLVAPALIPPGQANAAKVNLQTPQMFTFASVNFDRPAFDFQILCYWPAQHRHASIVIEGFKGIDVLSRKTFSLTAAQAGMIEMQDPRGFTRILCRFVSEDAPGIPAANPDPTETIEIVSMQYQTVLEQQDGISNLLKCQNNQGPVLTGKGKLAWLPNHNYEITLTTRVALQHNQTGMQQAEMVQRAYFRTRGMIGLNYGDHIGHEIEPYLDATFPRPDAPIVYREEPVAMSFKDQFNILLPVDRSPDPNNPAELNQVLEWDLTVDKQGDPFGQNRISKSNPDWIIEHRGTGSTNPFDFTVLIGQVLSRLDRTALSTDPRRLRLQSILASPHSCGGIAPQPQPSQVLMHQPIDPSQETAVPLWEANKAFRVNLKPKGGPCIHRDPFEPDDVSSFKPFTEQGFSAGSWVFADGGIHLAPAAAPGLRYYAVFGEIDWNYIQVSVQLDPKGAAAGIAIGVQTDASGVTGAMLALVDQANGILKIQQWQGGAIQDLQQTSIPPNLAAPFQLDLVAYDDQLEVRLDDARLVAERTLIRSGQLALVGQNGGAFSRLAVEALDAYRFYFQSSRYVSFEQHILSAGSGTLVIPAGLAGGNEIQIIANQYAATSGDIGQLMQPGADTALRLALFQRWAEVLSLPLVQQPQALTISRLEAGSDTALLLFESPEPLRFSEELVLTIEKEVENLPPGPLPPGISALERAIPADLQSLKEPILKKVPGIKSIEIQQNQILAVIENGIQPLPPPAPRYALTALYDQGHLKYFLFELSFAVVGHASTSVTGLLRDENNFNPILQHALVQSLAVMIHTIEANQLFLLDSQGALIKKLLLPFLSLPFFAPQLFSLLSNGNETRAILIPLNNANSAPATWTGGNYRFHFTLNRKRYRQESPDPNAVYEKEIELDLAW